MRIPAPPNPIRSEASAFGCLIWGVCVVALVIGIVLAVRALT
ncbi:MAG TPA: hypothetical protein VKV27_15860 [Solirubrobacteraceae bacterium]|nr:hypothetical protein [Solirubrobacteraceae bacterium]